MACVLPSLSGCFPSSLWLNQSKQRTGNIQFVFINTTPFAASFTYGTWDALDKSPGPVTAQQISVDANSTSEAISVSCRRNAAVASQGLYDRVVATETDERDDWNPDQFDTVVHFTSAPAGSGAADLPTAGTALGIERLLGVDYSCGDQLIFTFRVDPDAPGGFRIDFQVIRDALP